MNNDTVRRAREQRQRDDLIAGLRLETRLREANPPTPARAAEERRRRHERIARLLRDAEAGVPDASYVDEETAALLRAELASIERDGAAADGTLTTTPLVQVGRSNTILYCRRWLPTVRFYRDAIGLPVLAKNEWYVEFRVTSASSLSVADSASTPIADVGGQGITLSWRVVDLSVTRKRLLDGGLEPSDIRPVGRAAVLYLHDPEGHRIEIWSDSP